MTKRRTGWASPAAIAALAATLAWIPARADAPADRAADVAAATAQATDWLEALDADRYDEGWNSLAAVMKQGQTQEGWTADIRGPRGQFGKPTIRKLHSAEFSTVVRGAPTGNYVTAAYLSQYSNTPPMLETILLTLEDGRWRIAGYSVGAAPEVPDPATPTDKPPASAPGG